MLSPRPHRWLHAYAFATPCVAMITVIVGALTTTMDAGMAFRDWPTSDGQGMFAYPWLSSTGDQFLEHGHRLAGMLIGFWSIGLVTFAWAGKAPKFFKMLSLAVLLCVILQGLLGGFRVWLDQRGLALLHGAFAACVLSLMASAATTLSTQWQSAETDYPTADIGYLKPLALITCALILGQYLVGGLIRHRGTGLYEHLVLGVITLVVILGNAILAHGGGVAWVRRSAWLLAIVAVAQVALGVGAWITKFGFATLGVVAVSESIQQVVLRTSHAVIGMLTLMAAVVHCVRVFRVTHVARPAVATPIIVTRLIEVAR